MMGSVNIFETDSFPRSAAQAAPIIFEAPPINIPTIVINKDAMAFEFDEEGETSRRPKRDGTAARAIPNTTGLLKTTIY